ncbi:MAG: hypothetical protein CFH41_02581 [Alphaproteobacteria bacterium MarineAlpha11_Bin1]|nr:MAG: hypothetical protein CFH41_02581 [Alphaproteobacteria bacterium MarineAlpha11_Bin1]|tara:strand:- start:24211 stop:24666 length:456 start_codon:yes stop_codon:yes gene_type:complete
MHTDFLPTRKIAISQLYGWNSQRAVPLDINLSHRGCVIRERFSGTAFLVSLDDQGYIRGATLFADSRDHLAHGILSEMTGCEWVNEYSDQWSLYRCWTESERDAHAREVAEDLAEDRAEADMISIDEAFEIEYRTVYMMHPIIIADCQVAA